MTSSDYDLYNARINMSGNTRRERTLDNIKFAINSDMYDHPSCKKVIFNDEPDQRQVIIINGDILTKKNIRSFPDETFNVGDMVFFEKHYWIITSIDVDGEIYTRGEMRLCTLLLRWQNPDTLEIIERWGWGRNPYSADVDEGKNISKANNKISVSVILDEETKLLDFDKRFLMTVRNKKPVAYKIVGHDAVTLPGLLEVKIAEDASLREDRAINDGHYDNWELMIADYIDPNLHINITPINNLLMGDTINLQYEIIRATGIITEFPIFYSTDESVATIDEHGLVYGVSKGETEIIIEYQNVKNSIIIYINDIITDDKILKITGGLTAMKDESCIYTAFILNNGIQQNTSVSWSMENINFVGKMATINNIDNNTIEVYIENNNKLIGKQFKLTCTANDNNDIIVNELIVTIKSDW